MKTFDQVFAALPQSVQLLYDFSNACYKGALTPIEGIRCATHGEFKQYAAQLRKGAGCPSCGASQRASALTLDQAEFVRRAEALHPGRYTYERTCYSTMKAKVVVSCPTHGDFQITPIALVHKAQGCPQCGSLRRGVRTSGVNVGKLAAATRIAKHAAEFEAKARLVHGDLYDYSKVQYTTARDDVAIICRKHGEFFQRVESHLHKQYGCPQCGQKSKAEESVARFLSIFTTVERRDRSVIKPKELDIFLPEHNLAIEYCGMYWHSHGDADSERKNKHNHFAKYQAAAAKGVRVITLFETEWVERQRQVKRLLRTSIGKLRGSVMARKCALLPVGGTTAREFFDKYHIQGGAGSGEHYGLYWDGKLVACMRFTLGGNDRGTAAKQRVWTLSRYATRVNVVGGASRLFTAFLRDYTPTEVKSFSDNRMFSGAMYEKLGFALESELSPDYQVWSQKVGLRPKAHYQRRLLPSRLVEHKAQAAFDPETDPRTEAEMTYLMGARRIYDCGKKRWRWTP
jgi:predicted  nucleic acid-binding Zn-ribbon protein